MIDCTNCVCGTVYADRSTGCCDCKAELGRLADDGTAQGGENYVTEP